MSSNNSSLKEFARLKLLATLFAAFLMVIAPVSSAAEVGISSIKATTDNGSVVALNSDSYPSGTSSGGNISGVYSLESAGLSIMEVSSVCEGIVYPNENNQPQKSKIDLNFTVSSPDGFNNTSYDINLSRGNDTADVTCSYNQTDSTTREYNCTAEMEYYFQPGKYDLSIQYNTSGDSVTHSNTQVCTYGKLVASDTITKAAGFSDAAPGKNNAKSDDSVEVKNTGNADLQLRLKAYNLAGNRNPSVSLGADRFKAGTNVSNATQLAHNTFKNVSVTVPAAKNSTGVFDLWLSMPADKLAQNYYAPNAWEIGHIDVS